SSARSPLSSTLFPYTTLFRSVIRGPEDNVLARFIQATEATRADVIVRVNGDAPLIDPSLIDRLVDTLIESDADTVGPGPGVPCRSEEHTSELQSLTNLVCRLL